MLFQEDCVARLLPHNGTSDSGQIGRGVILDDIFGDRPKKGTLSICKVIISNAARILGWALMNLAKSRDAEIGEECHLGHCATATAHGVCRWF